MTDEELAIAEREMADKRRKANAQSLRDFADWIDRTPDAPFSRDEHICVMAQMPYGDTDLEMIAALGPDVELTWSGPKLLALEAKMDGVRVIGTIFAWNIPEAIWPANRPKTPDERK